MLARNVPSGAIEQFVGFNKGQIGFAIFGGPALDLRLLHWREFRLQFAHDLLREISLNGKHIGQVAIVIFRPKVLVGVSVNQLHIHAHPIADRGERCLREWSPTPSAFPISRTLDVFPRYGMTDVREITFRSPIFRQIGKDVILNAVCKIGVVLFVAQIFKWQHRNRLVDLVRGDARQEKESGGSGNDHADCDKHE